MLPAVDGYIVTRQRRRFPRYSLAVFPASVQPTSAFAWPWPIPYSDLRWPTIAMCFSWPQFMMISCHSDMGRPYFFSIDGKYEAGPCFGHGAENSGTGESPSSGHWQNQHSESVAHQDTRFRRFTLLFAYRVVP
jgi:hypothetical protein